MTTTDTGYHCAICTRLIGKEAIHYLTETDVICCGWCLFSHQGTHPAHQVCYPDCPQDSHDMWDHTHLECPTRAALHFDRTVVKSPEESRSARRPQTELGPLAL
jgi:hypothetical protein